jgi:hypothetical protein
MGVDADYHPEDANRRHEAKEERYPLPITYTVLGVSEAALVALNDPRERYRRFVREDLHCFVHAETGHLTSYGNFSTPTIASLRQRVAALVPERQPPTVVVPPLPLTTRSGVDIGALQGQLTTAERAMVQVASNFNCLENATRHTRLDSGRFVDRTYLDCAQGPAAVFGTTSSYLYRCHFYHGGQSLFQRTGQNNVVNLLQHTREYFGTVPNGKLTLTGDETILTTEDEIDAAAAQVCIGLHQDCPIMFGRTTRDVVYNQPQIVSSRSDAGGVGGSIDTGTGDDDDNGPLLFLEYPVVDHVLSASINLHDYGTPRYHEDNDELRLSNLTRALLRAAYEGAYLAAILRRRQKLYLTLVGGGCFGNPIDVIVPEIVRAHELYSRHPASVLKECVICLYSRNDELGVQDAMDKMKKRP